MKKLSPIALRIALLTVSVALAASGATIGVLLHERQELRTAQSEIVTTVPVYGADGKPVEGPIEKNRGTISAPGYEMLEMKAGTAEQGFALANPAQNNCFMKISIVLSDGTYLWTSRPTAPGEATDEVVLSTLLAEGRYDGTRIIYACYRDEACTESLNSVVIDLYLLVR